MTTARDISVIIPTRNRRDKLAACLRALVAQTFAHDRFEVIVVDDGSDEPLDRVLLAFQSAVSVRLIRQSNAGPARARNAGAKLAAGTLLAFTDDDCEPDPEWLGALHRDFVKWPDRAIGGRTVNALPDNVCSAASQCLIDYLYDCYTGNGGPPRAAPAFFTSNNFAVAAALFRAIGGFDESFPLPGGEDRELCARWQERGYRLHHAPAAIVRHVHALTLRAFWHQQANYGRGAFHLRRVRAARGSPSIGVEPLSFYFGLLAFPLRSTRRRWPLLTLLMIVSQVANATGFFFERAHHRRVAVAAEP